MLDEGRTRLLNAGIAGNVDYVLADAEALPFAAQSFHCVTIGFGLRNVTDKQRALASLFDVLKPGGRLLVLEFSQRAAWARSRRCTSSTRFKCCRASANGSPATPRATATSPSRSAVTRIKKR